MEALAQDASCQAMVVHDVAELKKDKEFAERVCKFEMMIMPLVEAVTVQASLLKKMHKARGSPCAA